MSPFSSRRRGGSATTAALLAALVVAVALVGSSYILARSMDGLRAEMVELNDGFAKLVTPRQPEQAARRGGLDPEKRYEVKVDGAPAKGPESAKVTIVEISDFQCPFCKRVKPTLTQLLADYGDDVRLVYKHLPLDFHTQAPAAHAAAEAAHRQGKFWEMYDKIFEHQAELAPEKYEVWAAEIGLDVEQFKKDAASAEVKARVEADKQEVNQLGVTGTPSFFINGRPFSGAQPLEQFKTMIDEELKAKQG
jgi:protein-disulfide isomerase